MRSKLLLLLSCALFSSCTLKINEPEISPPTLSVTNVQQGCLANTGPTISRFLDGEIPESELNTFWTCLSRSFQMFADNTRGKNEDYYEPEELAEFMSKYFLEGKQVPAPLLKQAMNLKKGIMGGSSNKITRKELRDTVKIINALHEQSMKLLPFMPMSAKALEDKELSEDQLELALKTFETSMTEIGKSLEGSIGTYSFEEFNSLMRELKFFIYEKNSGKNWIDAAINIANALGPLKSMFVAPPAAQISQNDWPQFFYLVPKYYTLYLRANYHLHAPRDYDHGYGLFAADRLASESVSLLELALNNHPEGKINENEIDDVLNSFEKFDFSKEDIKNYRNILVTIFTKIFPSSNAKKFQITKESLTSFRTASTYLGEGLFALDSAYSRQLGAGDFFIRTMTKTEFLKLTEDDLLYGTNLQNDISRQAVRDILKSVSEIKTVAPNASNVAFVPNKKEEVKISFFHLAKLHILRTINALVLKAYSGSDKLSEVQVQAVFNDLKPVFDLLKIDSSSIQQTIHPRLFEASLFLPSSDGDISITMNEALEFETLLVSTLDRHKKIHEFIVTKCSKKFDPDGNSIVEAECYRRKLTEQIKRFWDYIPGLADYMNAMPSKEQINMIKKMDTFLRKGRVNSPYTLSDTKSYVLMPYYIELLFSRFDKNLDGLIDEKEAKIAYPVFEPFIAEKANAMGYRTADDHYKIFTYILSHQTLPKTLFEKAGFYAWKKDAAFNIDRGNVVTIFSTLLSL